MADIIVLRTGPHDRATTMATHSQVPVINALSDAFHPCQLLADIQTFCEHRGEMRDARVAFVGDGSSNVCQSWINAAAMMKFSLQIGAPDLYRPHPEIVAAAGRRCTLTNQPSEAVAGADLVVTDTWAGMGQEAEKAERLKVFHGFQIDSQEEIETRLSGIKNIDDGGAALTAYGKIQYSNMEAWERELIAEGLKRYCELDTLAMVMIYEHLKSLI